MAQSFFIGGIDNQSFDIDISGDYLYLAVQETYFLPQVLRLTANLENDATIEYDPQAGSEVQLQCGDLNTYWVWAVGDFGTESVVLFDDIGGKYWVTDNQSPYWYFPAHPLLVGPDDDQLALVHTHNDNKLFETYWIGDDGPYWIELTEDTPFHINSMDRLDVNLDDLLIGTYFYSSPYIVSYNPDGGFGDNFEDISGSLTSIVTKVTSLIFG